VELKIIAVIFLTKCDFCDEAFFVVEKILAKIIFGIIKLFLFFENILLIEWLKMCNV
jgi:hypothetical protein